jgi:hypothetical protein
MAGLPARGERVTILWPGGQYDFVMDVRDVQQHQGGWVLLHGVVVEPYRAVRDFYVRPADGGFSLAPKLLHTPPSVTGATAATPHVPGQRCYGTPDPEDGTCGWRGPHGEHPLDVEPARS